MPPVCVQDSQSRHSARLARVILRKVGVRVKRRNTTLDLMDPREFRSALGLYELRGFDSLASRVIENTGFEIRRESSCSDSS